VKNVVWIVLQDATSDNTVLGVFDKRREAEEFADSIKDEFVDHVLIEQFPIGYKFTTGSSRHST
jgi:hypothetical protein